MKHILFTLRGCSAVLLDDEKYIREMLVQTAKECNSTLLDISSHKFDPQGVTAVALLAESHISIHTWPENGEAVCDIFTCGDHTNPKDGFLYMRKVMHSQSWVYRNFIRPLG
ncbi:S-adenosylmethionine decarboxylase [Synechococcus phage S-SZBM1]|uniref:S-adenosylmethionine decarboxylase n=1 Tax=Synechococcus phage S-SZBM1 TaxID=2926475 RepID=A0AC61TSR5_9CAUD|nr:S-adenosylmethionine decarboxylase [Synechococcus phage S-SZBM1]UNH61282.1 S-adenosylmethionine decarboxylase [Synechococcus phage S-SZBM1]